MRKIGFENSLYKFSCQKIKSCISDYKNQRYTAYRSSINFVELYGAEIPRNVDVITNHSG